MFKTATVTITSMLLAYPITNAILMVTGYPGAALTFLVLFLVALTNAYILAKVCA